MNMTHGEVWENIDRAKEAMRCPSLSNDTFLHYYAIAKDLRPRVKKAGGILFDIGAGKAPYEPWFLPHVSHYIKSDAFIFRGGSPQVLADGHHLPIQSNAADTTVSFYVLEHVTEPQQFVHEMHRITKPGGYVFLTTAMAFPLHGLPHDYFRFCEAGLKHLFRNFSDVEIKQNGGSFLTVMQFLVWSVSEALPRFLALPLIVFFNWMGKTFDSVFCNKLLTTSYLVVAKK